MDYHGNLCGKLLLQLIYHNRNDLLQGLYAVCFQVNMQRIPLPLPTGAGKRSTAHGVLLRKQLHQILRLNALELSGRIGGAYRQAIKPIFLGNLSCYQSKRTTGYVDF